ncbi:DUF1351 domain-containing protein [Candidatus Gracilibacteria bacterium]|nr:DUF1351 domain-containing protein [Candidatus Gracilibacteria bacterium]MCF7819463.1 DUF1351 domain-containing protein [Candidatus Gracilibacteria bacterium]
MKFLFSRSHFSHDSRWREKVVYENKNNSVEQNTYHFDSAEDLNVKQEAIEQVIREIQRGFQSLKGEVANMRKEKQDFEKNKDQLQQQMKNDVHTFDAKIKEILKRRKPDASAKDIEAQLKQIEKERKEGKFSEENADILKETFASLMTGKTIRSDSPVRSAEDFVRKMAEKEKWPEGDFPQPFLDSWKKEWPGKIGAIGFGALLLNRYIDVPYKWGAGLSFALTDPYLSRATRKFILDPGWKIAYTALKSGFDMTAGALDMINGDMEPEEIIGGITKRINFIVNCELFPEGSLERQIQDIFWKEVAAKNRIIQKGDNEALKEVYGSMMDVRYGGNKKIIREKKTIPLGKTMGDMPSSEVISYEREKEILEEGEINLAVSESSMREVIRMYFQGVNSLDELTDLDRDGWGTIALSEKNKQKVFAFQSVEVAVRYLMYHPDAKTQDKFLEIFEEVGKENVGKFDVNQVLTLEQMQQLDESDQEELSRQLRIPSEIKSKRPELLGGRNGIELLVIAFMGARVLGQVVMKAGKWRSDIAEKISDMKEKKEMGKKAPSQRTWEKKKVAKFLKKNPSKSNYKDLVEALYKKDKMIGKDVTGIIIGKETYDELMKEAQVKQYEQFFKLAKASTFADRDTLANARDSFKKEVLQKMNLEKVFERDEEHFKLLDTFTGLRNAFQTKKKEKGSSFSIDYKFEFDGKGDDLILRGLKKSRLPKSLSEKSLKFFLEKEEGETPKFELYVDAKDQKVKLKARNKAAKKFLKDDEKVVKNMRESRSA